MRNLKRIPAPEILVNKKDVWTKSFIESGKSRPDSSKYANEAIRRNLASISFNKCFYCETLLKGRPKEVDHHIEVSVDKSKAFEWDNLYLSCDNCNNKLSHDVIAIEDALNPVIHEDEYIQQHITFNDEYIDVVSGSDLGLNTIKKYRLDTELLDSRRTKHLKDFYRMIVEIQKNQRIENRDFWEDSEIGIIQGFKGKNKPFSLMFEILLRKINI